VKSQNKMHTNLEIFTY